MPPSVPVRKPVEDGAPAVPDVDGMELAGITWFPPRGDARCAAAPRAVGSTPATGTAEVAGPSLDLPTGVFTAGVPAIGAAIAPAFEPDGAPATEPAGVPPTSPAEVPPIGAATTPATGTTLEDA